MILQFPDNRYEPSIDATTHEMELAEHQYEICRNAEFGHYPAPWPRAENLERFRAARERLHLAQDLAREARFTVLKYKLGAI